MEIKQLCEAANKTAESKGFWEDYNTINSTNIVSNDYDTKEKRVNWIKEQHICTKLALCITELAEAIESRRKGKTMTQKQRELFQQNCTKADFEEGNETFTKSFENHIKDTDGDELADTFIRLGDLCKKLNIDIEWNIVMKMKYNETRAKMHGKTY